MLTRGSTNYWQVSALSGLLDGWVTSPTPSYSRSRAATKVANTTNNVRIQARTRSL
jgi:hypothetical protein